VYLIKWPVSVYIHMFRHIKHIQANIMDILMLHRALYTDGCQNRA